MGEKMTPIPFKKLINRILCEYENEKTVFGVRYPVSYTHLRAHET